MNDIRAVQAIADRVARGDRDFGRVMCKEQGEYVLLTYTAEAQYGGNFTEVEKICRGLVVRRDGRIMALPLPKFFNLGEPQCPPLPDEPYTVWEKIDGSLGIFWHDGDGWRCNTRGSFDNEYTVFGMRDWIQCDWGQFFRNNWTVMCEICIDSDDMPRAAYKPQGLYLLAVRDNYSGADLSLLNDIPTRCWLDMPTANVLRRDISELIEYQEYKTGTEGWVVRFDSGFRVKIKTAWYLRLFRAMQSMTPKRIREMMVEAGENWIDEFPDDLRPQAIEIQEQIEAQFCIQLKRIYEAYSKVAHIETRKDYALAVMADYADLSGWLFNLRDDRFDEMNVLRRMVL